MGGDSKSHLEDLEAAGMSVLTSSLKISVTR